LPLVIAEVDDATVEEDVLLDAKIGNGIHLFDFGGNQLR
jgi:hypothetical protein